MTPTPRSSQAVQWRPCHTDLSGVELLGPTMIEYRRLAPARCTQQNKASQPNIKSDIFEHAGLPKRLLTPITLAALGVPGTLVR